MKPAFSRALARLGLMTQLLAVAAMAGANTISWASPVSGNWSVAGNWSPAQVPGAADDVMITVAGTYTVTVDAGDTINSLTLGGASGTQTLLLNSALTLQLNAASTVNANGLMQVTAGAISIPSPGVSLTVSGLVNFQGGTVGNLAITSTGTLNLTGFTMTASGTWTNAGTVNWTAASTFNIATFNNNSGGTFNMNPGGNIGPSSSATFNNNAGGIFNKVSGVAAPTVAAAFNNAGTVNFTSGTSLLFQTSYTQTAGATHFIPGGGGYATLGAPPGFNPSFTFTGGILDGNGILFPNSGAVIVGASAQINPGASAGLIQVYGVFNLNGGTYNAEIGGLVQFDRIDVQNGTASAQVNLNSSPTLNVSLIGGFVPAVGNQFRIINNEGVSPTTGTFAGLPEGATITLGGVPLQITYVGGDGNDVVLTAVATAVTPTPTPTPTPTNPPPTSTPTPTPTNPQPTSTPTPAPTNPSATPTPTPTNPPPTSTPTPASTSPSATPTPTPTNPPPTSTPRPSPTQVPSGAPAASFNFAPSSPVISEEVQFLDTSTGSPTVWLWDFGDPASGGADQSSQQNPTHAYEASGTYTVTLEASNAIGSSQSSRVLFTRHSWSCPNPAADLPITAGHSFCVSLSATDQRTGRVGGGQPYPQGDLFGYFSLPSLTNNPGNPEVFVKILDGRPVNGHLWVFYGGLTDLEYTLTVEDFSSNAVKRYHKDPGNACGGFDVLAFTDAGAGGETLSAESIPVGAVMAGAALPRAAQGLCSASDPGSLCLNAAHAFWVSLSARDQRTGRKGNGLAIPNSDVFGYFSIPDITQNPQNPEVFVKILDGRAVNGSFWVFYSGLTDLEYTVTVQELDTGRVRSYVKPAGSACGGFDVTAF
jgi:hypothetical protein